MTRLGKGKQAEVEWGLNFINEDNGKRRKFYKWKINFIIASSN